MTVSYATLYLPGSSQGMQVVEGGQLHLIYVAMGANSVPSAPGETVRQDPFPQYVDDAELAEALAAYTPGGGGGAAPDATTATQGLVRLAGDLAGTATAPTVPGLAGKADLSGGVVPDTQLPSRLADAALKAAFDARYPQLTTTPRRIFYNSTTSSWPSRPSVSVCPAGMAEYISTVGGVANPTDMQLGDTLEIATPAPANTVLPAISGTAQVGSVLTATTGTWTGSPTSYTYQWNRAGSAISGATSSTYTLVGADQQNTITVTVTATNAYGNASATSAATSTVLGVLTFNNTAANWTGSFGNCTAASSTTQVHNAAANSISMTSTATGQYSLDNTSGGRVAVTGGYSYTCTVYVYPTADLRQAALGFGFFDSGGASVSGGTVTGSAVVTTQNAWTAITATVTVPATATKISARPTIQWKFNSGTIPAGDLTYFSAT